MLYSLLMRANKHQTVAIPDPRLIQQVAMYIRESVDSLCRDDADMPMPPYIRKACNRPNAAFVSLFRYLTVIYGCFST